MTNVERPTHAFNNEQTRKSFNYFGRHSAKYNILLM